jgi:hypothetical protein
MAGHSARRATPGFSRPNSASRAARRLGEVPAHHHHHHHNAVTISGCAKYACKNAIKLPFAIIHKKRPQKCNQVLNLNDKQKTDEMMKNMGK